MTDPKADDAFVLAEAMSQHWQGHQPVIIGAALAQALAVWIASLPATHRDGHLEDHIAAVRRLIPLILEITARPSGRPDKPLRQA